MKKALLSMILAFTMILGTVTVFAADGTGFIDVKESRWSYANIMWSVENGYMNGVGDGRFNPAGATTRAMVVTVLWRIDGAPEQAVTLNRFRDVKAGKWYTDAIIWASVNGVVNGVTPDTFKPDDSITREQLAAIFYRFAEYRYVKVELDRKDLSGYKDAKKVSSYAKDAMSWAGATGLIGGVTEDTLNPKGNATREQFAAILQRFCEKEQDGIDGKQDGFEFNLAYNEPAPKTQYTEKKYDPVTDADVYVSPNGKDTSDGKTTKTPVKTFEKARDLVREIKKTKTSGGIKVAFMAGEYGKLDITLTSEDKGTADCPITYCKYGDGDVVFNNGATFRLSDFSPLSASERSRFTEKYADKIMKISLDGYFEAGLPAGITLYEGTTALNVARNPDKKNSVDNYYEGCIKEVNGDVHYPGMVLSGPLKREVDKCENVDGMKIIGYIIRGYRVDPFYVTGYDKTTGILDFDPEREVHSEFASLGVRTPGIEMDAVYVENNPKFLSDKGEFWCDAETNTLYVYDPDEDFNVGIDGSFLTLDDADYVNLVGLSFKNCYNENAINVRDSEHVTLDRVYVEGVTGNPPAAPKQGNQVPGTNTVLCVTGASEYLTVTECEFCKFKNHGIDLFPNRDAVYLTEDHMVVDKCFFHDCGNGSTFENNVIIGRSIGGRFTHNLFKDSESGAFELGTLSVIEYNIFDNMMTSTHDYGCIYSQLCNGVLSRENVIRYNIFNQKVNNGANYSIYLDDATTRMQVYGNYFFGSHAGVVIHSSRSHEVHDNVFVKAGYVISGLITCDGEGKLLEGDEAPSPTGQGGGSWWWNGLYRLCITEPPKEGQPGYEQWKEKFPDMYMYYVDLDNLTGQYNLACPYNELYNNIDIIHEENLNEDRQHGFHPDSAYALKVGNIHDNPQYSLEENPCFVDPTHGNYSIRDDSDLIMKIPFNQIGRY